MPQCYDQVIRKYHYLSQRQDGMLLKYGIECVEFVRNGKKNYKFPRDFVGQICGTKKNSQTSHSHHRKFVRRSYKSKFG